MTAFEWLHQWDPAARPRRFADCWARCCCSATKLTSRTDVLSGGEAARLLFCKLMLQKPNVLVLDEPTNHLDLESINALNIALQRYQGTVLLATHDHDLIDEVATRIWHFESDHKITDFKGTYEEYQAQLWPCRRKQSSSLRSEWQELCDLKVFAPFSLHVNQPGSPQISTPFAVAFDFASCG
jgi:ATPase subunit of ABC transporter with duplicated ATPase domains